MNIHFTNLMAFTTQGNEDLILQWKEDGQFRECTLRRKFDTKNPWKAVSESPVPKAVLNELFRQYVEQLEIN